MRATLARLGLVLLATSASSCLPAGDPCCSDDLSCAEGTRCFEGRCAPRCDDTAAQPDLQCAEGERCLPGAGVCRAADPDPEREACPYPARDGNP
jgi:hypothetical protein